MRRVHWVGGPPSRDEVAQILYAGIVKQGLRTYGAVARFVADRCFRRDFEAGGWVVDIGFLQGFYLREACRTLDRSDGHIIRIE